MYQKNDELDYPFMANYGGDIKKIIENACIIEGYQTPETFPAAWYWKTQRGYKYENFRWAGEIVIEAKNGKEVRYWSIGKEKFDVLRSLHLSLRVFQHSQDIAQHLEDDDFILGQMAIHERVDHFLFDLTDLGDQFWKTIKNATKSFHVYPNVQCRFCGRPLNHLFDDIYPKYADHADSFHCYSCWQYEIPKEIEARCPTKKLPSPSEIMRRKAYAEGDRGIHWTTVGPREKWICHLCGEEVEKVGGTDKYPQGAQIEHIIPISKGGPHTWDNVKLSHRSCNLKKGTKITEGQQP